MRSLQKSSNRLLSDPAYIYLFSLFVQSCLRSQVLVSNAKVCSMIGDKALRSVDQVIGSFCCVMGL